jgi:hypothetical protein
MDENEISDNFELTRSNHFMNFINYKPNRKLLNFKDKHIYLTEESFQIENKSNLLNSYPMRQIKSAKKSPKRKKFRSIFSPNSLSKIGYLRHFNNNSFYYSNQKKNNLVLNNKKYKINTEVRPNKQKKSSLFSRNKSNFSKLLKMKIKAKFSLFNKRFNRNEDSKNNSIIEEDKKEDIYLNYNFLNRNTETNSGFYNIKRMKTEFNSLDLNFKTKKNKNLLNIFSPENIFNKKDDKDNLLNTSKLNKTKKYLILKINQFPVKIIPKEYTKKKVIGNGSFGKIYKVIWNINNTKYAMKEMHFQTKDNIIYLKERVKYITEFQKKTQNDGVIKIYGCSYYKRNKEYYFYEVMELADRDWEQEINMRYNDLNYYSEKELLSIMSRLIRTLSDLQKNHITHRDIKLQNILLVNNKYKLCDFGESRKINQKGTIVQPVRGSELYMSPILFFGLNEKLLQVTHNTYKSDVFSLGMCILYAATLSLNSLYDIREMTDMKDIRYIIEKYCKRYSFNLIEILLCMLEVNEKKRPDFIQLEKIISLFGIK